MCQGWTGPWERPRAWGSGVFERSGGKGGVEPPAVRSGDSDDRVQESFGAKCNAVIPQANGWAATRRSRW